MNSLSDPETKILYHPDRLAAFKHGIAYPISAEIDLTKRCALKCKGCHSKHLHESDSSADMQPEAIKRVLLQLRMNGCQAVTWSGGGDPFESPHWRYAVNLAHDMGFDQAAYSYLPGFNQEMADFLGGRLAFVYTHSVSTKNIVKPKGSKTIWTYGYLLDSENWNKVHEMVAKVNFEFFDFCDFRPLAPENKMVPSKLDYSWVPEGLRVLKSVQYFNPKVKFAEYKFTRMDQPREYTTCFSTDLTTCVGPDGTVWECLNRRGFPDSALGNLLSESLLDIWARKPRCRKDLNGCRLQCRNDSMNRTLFKIFGTEDAHANFV